MFYQKVCVTNIMNTSPKSFVSDIGKRSPGRPVSLTLQKVLPKGLCLWHRKGSFKRCLSGITKRFLTRSVSLTLQKGLPKGLFVSALTTLLPVGPGALPLAGGDQELRVVPAEEPGGHVEVEGGYRRVVQLGLVVHTVAVVQLHQRLPRPVAHHADVAPDILQLHIHKVYYSHVLQLHIHEMHDLDVPQLHRERMTQLFLSC